MLFRAVRNIRLVLVPDFRMNLSRSLVVNDVDLDLSI